MIDLSMGLPTFREISVQSFLLYISNYNEVDLVLSLLPWSIDVMIDLEFSNLYHVWQAILNTRSWRHTLTSSSSSSHWWPPRVPPLSPSSSPNNQRHRAMPLSCTCEPLFDVSPHPSSWELSRNASQVSFTVGRPQHHGWSIPAIWQPQWSILLCQQLLCTSWPTLCWH